MTVLEGFRLKSFDLEPVYTSWPDGPKFVGNPKKDPPVDEWLKQIKAGCEERKVPREYWHKVAQHYMGEKAKARLTELKAVMAKVNGGDYHWNWDKFKIAMRNMGWNVDASEMKEIKVETKRSWWLPQKDKAESPVMEEPTELEVSKAPATIKGGPSWMVRKIPKDNTLEKQSTLPPTPSVKERPVPTRGVTLDIFHRPTKKDDSNVQIERPSPQKSKSDNNLSTTVMPKPSRSKTLAPASIVTVDNQSEAITTTATAPVWLVNACTALDFLQGEHPKVMSTLGAILITAGSIPAIPAISAGAGGAFLASGAVQAAGAIAVGVGSWLRAQNEKDNGSQSSVASEKSV